MVEQVQYKHLMPKKGPSFRQLYVGGGMHDGVSRFNISSAAPACELFHSATLIGDAMLGNIPCGIPFSDKLDVELTLDSGRKFWFTIKNINVTSQSRATAESLVEHVIQQWKQNNFDKPMDDAELPEVKAKLVAMFLKMWKVPL